LLFTAARRRWREARARVLPILATTEPEEANAYTRF
jgi:hypothetical protein